MFSVRSAYIKNLIKYEIDKYGYDYRRLIYHIQQYANLDVQALSDLLFRLSIDEDDLNDLDVPVVNVEKRLIPALVFSIAHILEKPKSQIYTPTCSELTLISLILTIQRDSPEIQGKTLSLFLLALQHVKLLYGYPEDDYLQLFYDLIDKLEIVGPQISIENETMAIV